MALECWFVMHFPITTANQAPIKRPWSSTHLAFPLQCVPPPPLLLLHPLRLRPLLLLQPLLFLGLQPPLSSVPGGQALRLCAAMLSRCRLLRLSDTSGGAGGMPSLCLGSRSSLLLSPQRLAPRLGCRLLLVLHTTSGAEAQHVNTRT